VYLGCHPSSFFAFVVTMTTDVRALCSHSSSEGMNGNRAIVADAAEAFPLAVTAKPG
jgi:hypothetical protein